VKSCKHFITFGLLFLLGVFIGGLKGIEKQVYFLKNIKYYKHDSVYNTNKLLRDCRAVIGLEE
jgi:hypothetical protein